MNLIPLSAIPSQSVQVVLNNQNCTIKVYTKSTGMFFDLLVDGDPVVLGRLCLDRNYLVRYVRLGFIGDFFFVDSQGTSDPVYTGLGARFNLYYSAE